MEDLVMKLLGQDLEWSLLTRGRCSDLVVSTGLTELLKAMVLNRLASDIFMSFCLC